MAKRRSKSSGMTCPPGACGPKCIIWGLISAAFLAAALLLLVHGIATQWAGFMPWTKTWLWYFGGFILFCIGKMCKMKACGTCRAA